MLSFDDNNITIKICTYIYIHIQFDFLCRLVLFKGTAFPNPKFGIRYLYEKVFSILKCKPIIASCNETEFDFTHPPLGADNSYVNCGLEAMRHIGRFLGQIDFNQSLYVPIMAHWSILSAVLDHLQGIDIVPELELDALQLCVNAVARTAGSHAIRESTLSAAQLTAVLATVNAVNARLNDLDPRKKSTIPVFDAIADDSIADYAKVCHWPLFGRFRCDFDVEVLAGTTPDPPIFRPIEMTLVPEKVSNFHEVAVAMRHALNLCVLLSNQRTLVRNSFTLRVCLIQHLFVRVIPVPLPITDPRRDTECFWHAQDMRYETQADILRLVNMLCRQFTAASLSVKATRSGDAVRILTFACMASVCDAVLRKIASDVPAQSSLHYSGRALGPLAPFGFDVGDFAEESEYLKFATPEAAAARTQVLDYFYQMKKVVRPDHLLFQFDKSNDCGPGDKRFMDQLCLQLGFKRRQEINYWAGTNSALIDLYPELAVFRDLVFMFKLVMVPTIDQLPELKPWEPEEVALTWKVKIDDKGLSSFLVTGFGKTLDCSHVHSVHVAEAEARRGQPKVGLGRVVLSMLGLGPRKPRCLPSQANPSILLGEKVETEDDILHIRTLPDFDGSLGAKDCELMLQYLLAPYLRIPLLLNFFSNEVRLRALRNSKLQEVLDSAMFEPARWKEEDGRETPSIVPAPDREHLCTPAGLLFNEIIMAPDVILSSIQTMLERVVDMDTGRYSALSGSILYVVRLAVKVESYLLFLVRNREFHAKQRATVAQDGRIYNGAYQEASVRGLDCSDETVAKAMACQKTLRTLLDEKVFRIIARWIKKSKQDGLMTQACILHAHLAYLYRDVEKEDLTPRTVFAIVSTQIFLFNNYKCDLDVDFTDEKKTRKDSDETSSDLVIPQVELFDMFQRNRTKILDWLLEHEDVKNDVSSFKFPSAIDRDFVLLF